MPALISMATAMAAASMVLPNAADRTTAANSTSMIRLRN